MKSDTNIKLVNMGCRLNAFESEIILEKAKKQGYERLLVINSCAITAEAERQLGQQIRKSKKAYPDYQIVVVGCAVDANRQKYEKMPEVSLVIGNEDKLRDRILDVKSHGVLGTLPIVENFLNRTRAFVQVQNGCDNACTYCIVPLTRGKSVSYATDDIIAQIKKLVQKGFKEVVLTGVDISAYRPSLAKLVRDILVAEPQLLRLRLSSLDPNAVDAELLRVFAEEERVMPHVHLSIQAGDDMILKRMLRRHNRGQVVELCGKIRVSRVDAMIGADFITGFPTETDEMFLNTYNLVKEANINFLHVFPYSERYDTPAAKMPPVPVVVRKERAAVLRRLQDTQLENTLASFIGRSVEVLVEKDNLGYTANYVSTKIVNSGVLPSSIVKVLVKEHDSNSLIGEII